MESSRASSAHVYGRQVEPQPLQESPVQYYAGDFISRMLNKAQTPIDRNAPNRDWLAAGLIPIYNLFKQCTTFSAYSEMRGMEDQEMHAMQRSVRLPGRGPLSPVAEHYQHYPRRNGLVTPSALSLSQSQQEEEEEERPMEISSSRPPQQVSRPPLAQHEIVAVNLPVAKLKSLAVGNVAVIVIAIAVSLLGGLGFTLIHGLAHLTIACSVINLIDVATIAKKQGKLDQLYTDLGEVVQGNSRRRRERAARVVHHPAYDSRSLLGGHPRVAHRQAHKTHHHRQRGFSSPPPGACAAAAAQSASHVFEELDYSSSSGSDGGGSAGE